LVVIDVSSVKEEIVHIFAGLTNKSIEFVGTHPMAGKERGGFAHSEPTLFVNKPWIITPHHKNRSETLDAVNELILFCGAIPIVLNADTHDHQVALISHLPALLARSYFSFVSDTAPESLAVAGPGFKSFTRLAHDNSAMHAEIYRSNEKLIQHYLKLWLEHLTTKRS
jgi:prephenate dehydrogenase